MNDRQKFCTAINCMDGRVQLPVIKYMMERFGADCVDAITEPGPNRIIAEGSDTAALESVERRLKISVELHKTVGIAVVGHYDCGGNPSSEPEQHLQTVAAVEWVRSKFRQVPVIGLWVDANWTVAETCSDWS